MGILDDVEGFVNDTVTGVAGILGGVLGGLAGMIKSGAATGDLDPAAKTMKSAWASANPVAAAALVQQGWTVKG